MRSKNAVLLLAGLVLGLAFTPRAEAKFAFGPQGGIVFPDFSIKSSPFGSQFDNDNGFLAGLFFEIGAWTLTFRPEINYVEKGYTLANTAEVTQKYLEVPVLLKINPFGEMVFSPFLLLGPSWSRRISTETRLLNTTTTFSDTADKWDIAGVAGLGAEFNLSDSIALNAQGRYNFGFRDVDDSTTEVRVRAFYLMGGMSFIF